MILGELFLDQIETFLRFISQIHLQVQQCLSQTVLRISQRTQVWELNMTSNISHKILLKPNYLSYAILIHITVCQHFSSFCLLLFLLRLFFFFFAISEPYKSPLGKFRPGCNIIIKFCCQEKMEGGLSVLRLKKCKHCLRHKKNITTEHLWTFFTTSAESVTKRIHYPAQKTLKSLTQAVLFPSPTWRLKPQWAAFHLIWDARKKDTSRFFIDSVSFPFLASGVWSCHTL